VTALHALGLHESATKVTFGPFSELQSAAADSTGGFFVPEKENSHDQCSSGSTMTPAPIKPFISADDLDKIDIRVGTILAVENVANSDKLVKLLVEFGDHKRTIVAGMKKERQDPKAEVEGKQALFVVNLEPRRMAGEVSEGMLFDIGYADKVVPVLAVPEKSIPNGTRAG
jgi:tRNA-binding protein